MPKNLYNRVYKFPAGSRAGKNSAMASVRARANWAKLRANLRKIPKLEALDRLEADTYDLINKVASHSQDLKKIRESVRLPTIATLKNLKSGIVGLAEGAAELPLALGAAGLDAYTYYRDRQNAQAFRDAKKWTGFFHKIKTCRT